MTGKRKFVRVIVKTDAANNGEKFFFGLNRERTDHVYVIIVVTQYVTQYRFHANTVFVFILFYQFYRYRRMKTSSIDQREKIVIIFQ